MHLVYPEMIFVYAQLASNQFLRMLSRVQRIWLFLENKKYRPFDGCKIEI